MPPQQKAVLEPFLFGTKAETLRRLACCGVRTRFQIPPFDFFSVSDYRANQAAILRGLQATFPGTARVIVRSSAFLEDGGETSMAGAFSSQPHVDPADPEALARAIEQTIASYHGDPRDQVIVQRMIEDAAVAGVIMTHDFKDGSPYYVLNYDDESGRTDSITGGVGAGKTVMVHHEAADTDFDSVRVVRMVNLARELESLIGRVPMDIEFALDAKGRAHLFQVRRISLARTWRPETAARVSRRLPLLRGFLNGHFTPRLGLAGSTSILSNMADWNPAEMIGAVPRPLAASLYRCVITRDAWRIARHRMGYQPVNDEELMLLVAGRPYIDVRASFNSLLPEGLSPDTRERLVDAWLTRLRVSPELHDKVEFEVAQTLIDFTFEAHFSDWYPDLLPSQGYRDFKERLTLLTRSCLEPGADNSLAEARTLLARLESIQEARGEPVINGSSPVDLVVTARMLLEEGRVLGTIPFSVLARHAFMAESLLRSAVARNALDPERVQAFKRSVRTVMSRFGQDLSQAAAGQLRPEVFMRRYGHLRPGAYDILSPRYADRPELLQSTPPASVGQDRAVMPFAPTPAETRALEELLAEAGLSVRDPAGLLDHAQAAIVGREWGKFVFTRNVSQALECFAAYGDHFGLTRDDLSFLDVETILDSLYRTPGEDPGRRFLELAEQGRHELELAGTVKLPSLIRDTRDISVVPMHRSAPNFITSRRVRAPVRLVTARTASHAILSGALVCIENADPGFDWIFAKGIAGLITQYGGANSHMAIRAAELGLPAAIGCGERLFTQVINAPRAELDCAAKTIRTEHV